MEPFSDLRSLQHGSSNVPTPTYYLPPPFHGGSARANTLHITTHRCEVQTQTQTYYSDLQENAVSAPFGPSPGATSVAYPLSTRSHHLRLAYLRARPRCACRASPTAAAVAARCTRTFSRRSRRSQFPPPGVSPFSVGLSLPPGAISVADTDHADLQENTVSAPFPAQPHLSPEFGSPPGATSVAVGRYTYPRA